MAVQLFKGNGWKIFDEYSVVSMLADGWCLTAEEAAGEIVKTTPDGGEDEVVAVAISEIVEAIGCLDTDNTEHFTTTGNPKVTAIEVLLGKQITSSERDEAWELCKDS